MYAQHLCKLQSQNPSWMGRGSSSPHPSKELWAVDGFWGRESAFFSNSAPEGHPCSRKWSYTCALSGPRVEVGAGGESEKWGWGGIRREEMGTLIGFNLIIICMHEY